MHLCQSQQGGNSFRVASNLFRIPRDLFVGLRLPLVDSSLVFGKCRLLFYYHVQQVSYSDVLFVRKKALLSSTIPCQTLLEILRKSLYRRLNRPRCRITQGTKRFALNVVAEIQQQFCIFRSPATVFNALENLHQPISAFAARREPAASVVFVKLRQVLRRFNDIDGLDNQTETA